ncbi:MAG TPA: tripartite tricarboxylate transporter substrate binding protein [Xanthobacteraceae bacterium]
MRLARRRFLHLAAGAAAARVAASPAWAQAYPVQPVRFVVGFPAGAGADIAARMMGQRLSAQLGQPFFIENRPGAGGNIGAEMVARAAPDGYTLLLVNSSNAINASLYPDLKFNLIRDIAPVAGLFRGPFVMVVNAAFPAKDVPAFIAYAKANPGRINMASAGIGTAPHLAGELFKLTSGVDMVHVPYRGVGPALADLVAGRVQMMFASMLSALASIKDGRLRALAVTSASRWAALPDLPAVGEFLPGYEASAWFVVGAPRATPGGIVDRLNAEINSGLADPAMQARIAALGDTVLIGSSADMARLIADDTAKWSKVVAAAHIKAE